MKVQNSSADLVAAFLANGGKTAKIETGARAYSQNDIWQAVKGETGMARATIDAESDRAESSFWRKHDAYAEAKYMGASHDTAMRDADNA